MQHPHSWTRDKYQSGQQGWPSQIKLVKISNSVHYALCSETNLELLCQILLLFVLLYKLVFAHEQNERSYKKFEIDTNTNYIDP